jgi:hypothetical protein
MISDSSSLASNTDVADTIAKEVVEAPVAKQSKSVKFVDDNQENQGGSVGNQADIDKTRMEPLVERCIELITFEEYKSVPRYS